MSNVHTLKDIKNRGHQLGSAYEQELEKKLRIFFFKQKTAYEITYGDWSSDVCSSDLKSEPHAWCRARSWTGFTRWSSHTSRSRRAPARSMGTRTATSATRARSPRCGPNYALLSAATC